MRLVNSLGCKGVFKNARSNSRRGFSQGGTETREAKVDVVEKAIE